MNQRLQVFAKTFPKIEGQCHSYSTQLPTSFDQHHVCETNNNWIIMYNCIKISHAAHA